MNFKTALFVIENHILYHKFNEAFKYFMNNEETKLCLTQALHDLDTQCFAMQKFDDKYNYRNEKSYVLDINDFDNNNVFYTLNVGSISKNTNHLDFELTINDHSNTMKDFLFSFNTGYNHNDGSSFLSASVHYSETKSKNKLDFNNYINFTLIKENNNFIKCEMESSFYLFPFEPEKIYINYDNILKLMPELKDVSVKTLNTVLLSGKIKPELHDMLTLSHDVDFSNYTSTTNNTLLDHLNHLNKTIRLTL